MTDPIFLFQKWYDFELSQSQASLPSACCLSSIGLDGFPNARFVSLKATQNTNFIITGSVTARKGLEISQNPKVALTFWWESSQRQIRIQGNASFIGKEMAENYFRERSQASQLVSFCAKQGQETTSYEYLTELYHEAERKWQSQRVPTPESWGGISIEPVRIEFMEFKTSRLHHRMLFELKENAWQKSIIQP